MTISYNWLCNYLPISVSPDKLSLILTSLGLEVESFEKSEAVKGGLQGLVIGEVLESRQHPNAEKLKLTRVNIGTGEPLQVVCGAPNVAAGQKVVVAPVGATIYPVKGDPLTMKVAKIRGEESYGMICAEDEIGLGESHAGIMVLAEEAVPGTPASAWFRLKEDWIYEIGLTPNRMDAMSHLGVAKDVVAYLSVHDNADLNVQYPYAEAFTKEVDGKSFGVAIENTNACGRYAGVTIENVTVKESPDWLKQRLQSIGLRSINNIVDITNFILHETGQPLHAFDADKIAGGAIVVKNLPAGTAFTTLDEKERKVNAEDIMICDGNGAPLCFGGVFGGLNSGVTETTRNIFLESAWFNPVTIRKTSFRHNLRTDAATRFEKGVDISNTVNVLKRAALLIRDLGGGKIASEIADIYPARREKKQVVLTYAYLKRLSGKHYTVETVGKILRSLGFDILKESGSAVQVAVPFSKPDIELPADIVEEIMRVDGYDNVIIPQHITISPSVEALGYEIALRDKLAGLLAGNGFNEIVTNSITNTAYFDDDILRHSVKMLNSLSAELNMMRPSMIETGLQCVVHNLNRKNNNLRLFEFGKTYHSDGAGKYTETEKLCLYVTGAKQEASWKGKDIKSDFYYLKGLVSSLLNAVNIDSFQTGSISRPDLEYALSVVNGKQEIGVFGLVKNKTAAQFDIKQPVWYAELNWKPIVDLSSGSRDRYTEIPRFPAVQRDLAIVVDKQLAYEKLESAIERLHIRRLQGIRLFDVFESDKLGPDKKSFAVNFTFLDSEKTLTDEETEAMMQKIMRVVEKELGAEIRK
ncbi:MAG: phenylalanine--tRNA ligase subunit beta [Chitinophagaceae bacterium]|nr:phenylalanine--tRNA ligase subunit beta [Chitinophagaceae bacterium]MCW5925956.1 phenylalanine--tRNA ligase subunit beta [Chitinophagaceae bacterium]